MEMRKYIVALFATTALLLGGCASVPMASLEQDKAAKTFQPDSAKSKIYVYRNENFGAAIKMPVLINDKLVGDTAAKTFLVEEVEPGKHMIVSKTENDAMLEIQAEAGQIYYVWQEVKMGAFSARSKLHLVDEAKGQAGVKQCKLIK